jgi:hypothetical protein
MTFSPTQQFPVRYIQTSTQHGKILICKTNTIPVLMHQMCISINQVSSVVLRSKKVGNLKKGKTERADKNQTGCHKTEPNPSKDTAVTFEDFSIKEFCIYLFLVLLKRPLNNVRCQRVDSCIIALSMLVFFLFKLLEVHIIVYYDNIKYVLMYVYLFTLV